MKLSSRFANGGQVIRAAKGPREQKDHFSVCRRQLVRQTSTASDPSWTVVGIARAENAAGDSPARSGFGIANCPINDSPGNPHQTIGARENNAVLAETPGQRPLRWPSAPAGNAIEIKIGPIVAYIHHDRYLSP